ncbi:amino acid--tRNA ligase-related protein [Guyparkeria halophila]|uniref:Amino acid--tRNA ligase-related protein n=1 Tax=Guyparkeria halophila TaxID=47960 RepID=A0ABZ0YYQ5_9GAMM|nr:amino acid--tRNA ligase-related protein [Guyparkeria halophila]WQH17153.1 amino acid--tRNA ligase-related protein [Guyparkeria halophila]
MTEPEQETWRPGASADTLRQRARLKRRLRETLDARDWLEIDAPVLIDSPDFEPNIALFRATLPDGIPAGSLHSSPELAMKRLLCAYPDLPGAYYLGPVFRAFEAGRRHNPEFTMLEWYDNGATLETAIDTTLSLIQTARAALGLSPAAVERHDYGALFHQHCALDPYHADTDTLAQAAGHNGIDVADPADMARDDWLDLLMSLAIEPRLDPSSLTVVTGYPASQAAMARLQTSSFEGREIRTAARFEVYGGGLELANGYHELVDPDEQARRLGVTDAHGPSPSQQRFLAALAHGLPECSGVAMGVDRLLMWLTGAEDIDAVLPFSARRV